MTGASLAARCLALLGPVDGPVVVCGPSAGGLAAALARQVDTAGESPAAAVVAFVGTAASAGDRQALLAALRRRLAPQAPVVLVDHNQPRRLLPRLLGAALLLARGLPPARARYPAARELQALGFAVERLRLADGERLQLVLARRTA